MIEQIANKKSKQRGFSLLELSVVLIIVGILIYMTLVATTAQLEMGKIKSTQDKLNKIQAALIIYYQINNHLPCPAQGDVSSGAAGFGKEVTVTTTNSTLSDATCNTNSAAPPYVLPDTLNLVYIGVVPGRSLGLSDETTIDAWGDRISYIVSKNCVDPDNWAAANTYKCSSSFGPTYDGDQVNVSGKNGQAWPAGLSNVAVTAPGAAAYIIISHGKNTLGAYPRIGSSGKITSSTSGYTSPYELRNANLVGLGGATALGNSYYDMPTNDGNVAGSFIDDIVLWNTAAQIDYNANH